MDKVYTLLFLLLDVRSERHKKILKWLIENKPSTEFKVTELVERFDLGREGTYVFVEKMFKKGLLTKRSKNIGVRSFRVWYTLVDIRDFLLPYARAIEGFSYGHKR